MLYIGCPQWSSNAWKGNLFSSQCKNADMLSQYAQHFNSVEGNTSFYADPRQAPYCAGQTAYPTILNLLLSLIVALATSCT